VRLLRPAASMTRSAASRRLGLDRPPQCRLEHRPAAADGSQVLVPGLGGGVAQEAELLDL
jgi:hypothetical protein